MHSCPARLVLLAIVLVSCDVVPLERRAYAMKGERSIIRKLHGRLVKARQQPFPKRGERIKAPTLPGVYVIFSPGGRVYHVGRTTRGKRGLAQGLADHMAGKSSFTIKVFGGEGSRLRSRWFYSYLEVADGRDRALLEALAIGTLCPFHIGVGEPVIRST
jgi:hypothetical protein